MSTTKEDTGAIVYNLTITKERKYRYSDLIVGKQNINNACVYAGITYRRFIKGLKQQTTFTNIQADKLDEFCDRVEGVKEPVNA